MFNALNRFISRLDSDAPSQQSQQNTFGFQVLRNKNADLPIEPWFDFIVGINGRMIEDSDPNLFAQEVRNCAGGTVALALWSAKGQRTRTLHIPVDASSPSLGLTLQHAPLSTTHTLWHILEVPPASPAASAGLLPYSDYILGTPLGTLHSESALSELVDEYLNRPLPLWVYNQEYDVVREVTIHPSRDWGGEGALGCVLGYGALHRLPAPLSEPVAEPGQVMFDGAEIARFSQDEARAGGFGAAATLTQPPPTFMVPAQMASTPPPPITSPEKTHAVPHRKRNEKVERLKGGRGMGIDDYFMEGEKKSRELDYVSTPRGGSTPPPPPPKAGGGPPQAASGPPKGGPPKGGPPKAVENKEDDTRPQTMESEKSVD